MAFDPDQYLAGDKQGFDPDAYLKTPIQDPLTAQTNRAALAQIGQAIPEPVKRAGTAVAETAQAGFQALPESVQTVAKKTGNFLLDAIDYLQRPFQAQAVGLKEARKTAETTVPERSFAGFLSAARPEFTRPEVIAGAKRGFKGEEKASLQELLPDSFRKEQPLAAATIGFLGDAVTDPLNIVAPFAVTKSIVKATPESVSIPSRLTDNELFRAFNITTGDADKARELYNSYRYLRDKAKNEGVRNAKELNNRIKVLSKQTDIPEAELKAKIVHDIETANLSDDAIGALEREIIERNRSLLEQQRAAGVDIGDLGETYMPHILTKEADDILNNAGVKNFFGIRPSAKNPQALAREIEGTVADINAKNLYGSTKFFQDDPAILQGIADFRAANAIAGKKFLEDAKALGVKADEAPTNYVTVPEISGFKFEPGVAKLLNRSYRALSNTEEINKVLKVYDGAQNWWKMWSLGVRPAYHTKNAIGNVWNAYLGGLSNPARYGDAAAFQTKLAQNKLAGTIVGKPVNELYEAMAIRGVFGEGQYGGDIARNLEKEIQGGSRNPLTLSVENPVLQAGFAVGKTIEDNARIALFLDQVKKGKTYDQAGRHVQKYLFDYGDVSPFEQSVLKRFMPFYTWSRKNIPLQLEAIALHPDKINKLNLAKENLQMAYGGETLDPSQVPDYVVEGMPVYLSRDKTNDRAGAILLQNLIPFADLAPFAKFLNTDTAPSITDTSKLDPKISMVMSGVSPFLKTPIEMLANYDFFRQRAITTGEGQKTDFLGVEMPVYLAKLASNIVVLSEIDRLNPGQIFGSRVVDPATGEITQTPSIFGATRESRTDRPEEERQLQALTGIRVLDLDLAMTAFQKQKKLQGDIDKLRGQLRSGAVQEKSREIDRVEKALDWYMTELDRYEAERIERMRQ